MKLPHRLGAWGTWLRRQDWLFHIGLLVGLVIFYRGSYQLPISAAGLSLFGIAALIRPDLALVYVPMTVPLFFMPKGIWDVRYGIRASGIRFPLHEVVLLVTLATTLLHMAVGAVRGWLRRGLAKVVASLREHILPIRPHLLHWLPMLLLLVAGSIGVWIVPAAERGNALREWRWLIAEPLIFYGLVRWHLWQDQHQQDQQQDQQQQQRDSLRFALVWGFVIGGGLVGLVGILQYWGINLAPHIGDEVGFSQDVLVVEGVKRVNSVYGHANNLALTMGRVWALAGVLALAYVEGQRKWVAVLAGGLCLFALGGLYVAFSKGANLGALAGVLFLLAAQVGLILRGGDASARQRVVPLAVLLVIVLFVMASGMRVERLQLMGASSHVRLMTWASAWEIIQSHPLLGLGLDQFNRVYQQVMHPSLVGTTEQYISHPHNLLFDLWLRVGVLGIVAFAWLLGRFFRRVGGVLFLGKGAALALDSRVRLLYAGAGAAMLASIVHGMVDNWYFVPDLAMAFWLLVAVVE